MNLETFEAYRIRHTADQVVTPIAPAEAASLRERALTRLETGERSQDQRVEALALVAYERSGSGTRSYASSIDQVLEELVADVPAELPAAAPAPAAAAAADTQGEATAAAPAKED